MNKKATQNNFDKYLSREYLDREYFKACILRGDNVQYNPSLHSNIISKDNYEQLIKKAEITVCSHNKQIFSVDEDVKIDLDVKNVNSMSMSIYEINTENNKSGGIAVICFSVLVIVFANIIVFMR